MTTTATPTLPSIAESVRALQAELNELFPEREALIMQLVYGLLTREHVLVSGRFGTGKSRLVENFFGAFTGANMFSVELTKFMTESNIVGIPNPRILREEGRIWHERKGTMLDARFAELDELFDANDYLLRTLLGILNERRFNRGVQLERANLHMAFASTNSDPEVEIRRSPTLGAVVDRFLFYTKVAYLTTDESRRRMYGKYLSAARPTTKIAYGDVELLAQAVSQTPIDPALLDLHNQVVQAWQTKSGKTFSDRRKCQALKLVQASAVLFDREEVGPEDFLAVMWAFCDGHDTAARDAFKGEASPLIDKAVKDLQPDVVRTQARLLEELERRLAEAQKGWSPATATADDLVSLRRVLTALERDLGEIKPGHASIEDKQKELRGAIERTKAEVGKHIDGEAGT